jgi:hypothetical protein
MAGGAPLDVSASSVNLPPEGVDTGVPLLRDLLEGLVGLLLHDLEPRAGDQFGDGAAKRRARGRVPAAGEDKRRGGDLRQAVDRVVIEAGVEVALQVIGPQDEAKVTKATD